MFITALCCVSACRLRFDTTASMFINATQVGEFLRTLPSPMGLGLAQEQVLAADILSEIVGACLSLVHCCDEGFAHRG